MNNNSTKKGFAKIGIKRVFFISIIMLTMVFIFACGKTTNAEVVVNPNKNNPDGVIVIGPDGIVDNPQFEPGVPDAGSETAHPVMSHTADYDKYRGINTDVLGWLSVPRTKIEYPVVRAKDNKYYLYRNIDGKESSSGTIFMDYRNTDPENDRHVIIWGHNMRNGTMFHDLTQYKHADFFNNNRDITLYSGDKEMRYEIYAAYIVNVSTDFIRTGFASDDVFLTYMNDLRGLCKFTPTPNVTLTKDDHILTLITCTYEYDDSRYVVQARRIS